MYNKCSLKIFFCGLVQQKCNESIFKELRKQRKHPVFVAKIAKMGL